MPGFVPPLPESTAVRNWIESKVIALDGYEVGHIVETTVLYSSRSVGGDPSSLLAGLSVTRPAWTGRIHASGEMFFRALGCYLSEIPSHLLQLLNHDGAYWEVRRVQWITSDVRSLPWVVDLIDQEPADEAGATLIMLLADDRQSAIVLAHSPYPIDPYPSGFCIAFHGAEERRELFLQLLEQTASATEAIFP